MNSRRKAARLCLFGNNCADKACNGARGGVNPKGKTLTRRDDAALNARKASARIAATAGIEKVEKKLAFSGEVRYNFSIVYCWDGTVGSAIDS
jgi:hypothetical protein